MDFEHKLLELLSHAQTFGGSSTDAGVRARDLTEAMRAP